MRIAQLLATVSILSAMSTGHADVVAAWRSCVATNIRTVLSESRQRGNWIRFGKLSEVTGIGQSNMSAIGLGKKPISLAQGQVLASYLNVATEWLLCFELLRVAFDGRRDTFERNRASSNGFFNGVAHAALTSTNEEKVTDLGSAPVLIERSSDFLSTWRVAVGERLDRIIKARWGTEFQIVSADITAGIGMNHSRISDVRRGKKSISLDQGLALAKFLGVPASWFLDFALIRDHYRDGLTIEDGSSDRDLFYKIARYALQRSPEEIAREVLEETAMTGQIDSRESNASASATCGKLLETATPAELVNQLKKLGWTVNISR